MGIVIKPATLYHINVGDIIVWPHNEPMMYLEDIVIEATDHLEPDIDTYNAFKEKGISDFVSKKNKAYVYKLQFWILKTNAQEMGLTGFDIFVKSPPASSPEPSEIKYHTVMTLPELSPSSQPLCPNFSTLADTPDIELHKAFYADKREGSTNTTGVVNLYTPKRPKTSGPLSADEIEVAQRKVNRTKNLSFNTVPAFYTGEDTNNNSWTLGGHATQQIRDTLAIIGESISNHMAFASPSIPSFAATISKASVGMDWWAKPNPAVIVDPSIRHRRSLVKERDAAETAWRNSSSDSIDSVLSEAFSSSPNEGDSSFTTFQSTVVTDYVKITRKIEIPHSSLKSAGDMLSVSLVPIIEATDEYSALGNKTYSVITFFVNDGDNVRSLMTPMVPPVLMVQQNSPGKVSLSVTSRDPVGGSVTLHRTVYKKLNGSCLEIVEGTKAITDNPQVLKANKNLVLADLLPQGAWPNIVEYTVTLFDHYGAGGVSQSVIIHGRQKVSLGNTTSTYEIGISAVNKASHIEVDVTSIPTRCQTMRLIREDIHIPGTLTDRCVVIKSPDEVETVRVSSAQSTQKWIDASAIHGRTYRYFLMIRFFRGSEQRAVTDEIIKRLVPIKAAPVNFQLGNPSVSSPGPNGPYSINFKITSQPAEIPFKFLVSLMEQENMLPAYISKVLDQKDKFAELTAFLIERINLDSGDRVSFGVFEAGDFTDSPLTQQVRGITGKPLLPGTNYVYQAHLLVRPPEAFLQGIFSEFGTVASPGIKSRQVLSQKFMSAYSNAGQLPSNFDLVEGVSLEDAFLAGRTSHTRVTYSIKTPKSVAVPADIQVSKGVNSQGMSLDSTATITWQSSLGDVSNVAYAVVRIHFRNGIIPLASRSMSQSKYQTYTDKVYAGQPGSKEYSVVFYYNDGTPPQASASVKFSVKTNLPDKLLLDEKTSVYGQIKKSVQEKDKDKTFSQETDYSTDKFTS